MVSLARCCAVVGRQMPGQCRFAPDGCAYTGNASQLRDSLVSMCIRLTGQVRWVVGSWASTFMCTVWTPAGAGSH